MPKRHRGYRISVPFCLSSLTLLLFVWFYTRTPADPQNTSGAETSISDHGIGSPGRSGQSGDRSSSRHAASTTSPTHPHEHTHKIGNAHDENMAQAGGSSFDAYRSKAYTREDEVRVLKDHMERKLANPDMIGTVQYGEHIYEVEPNLVYRKQVYGINEKGYPHARTSLHGSGLAIDKHGEMHIRPGTRVIDIGEDNTIVGEFIATGDELTSNEIIDILTDIIHNPEILENVPILSASAENLIPPERTPIKKGSDLPGPPEDTGRSPTKTTPPPASPGPIQEDALLAERRMRSIISRGPVILIAVGIAALALAAALLFNRPPQQEPTMANGPAETTNGRRNDAIPKDQNPTASSQGKTDAQDASSRQDGGSPAETETMTDSSDQDALALEIQETIESAKKWGGISCC